MPWWFSFLLASLSFAALVASLSCLFRVRSLLRDASLRSLATLGKDVAELTSVSESHGDSIKRLASRASMQDLRARRRTGAGTASEDIGETLMTRQQLKEIARARGFKVT